MLPAAIYGFSIAEKKWLPSALLPEIRQEFDRTARASSQRHQQKSERIRGEIVYGEDE
jgi:hypothetical protein